MTRTIRQIRFDGDVAYVPLTKGFEAVIDAADADLVSKWNWSAFVTTTAVYAYRAEVKSGKRKAIFLHRFLMNVEPGTEVDHIDRDGLNNRRANLRPATHAQNQCNSRLSAVNTSGFKGVTWHKGKQKWQAQIHVAGRMKYLGRFDDKQAAHAAYAKASMNFFGEFARLA